MNALSALPHQHARQREETSGAQSQLPLISALPVPQMVPTDLINACANARQALSLCIRLSGYTDEVVADRIGISKGYLSKVLNGRASLDSDRRIRLMRVCGNLAPAQYEAQAMGCTINKIDARAAEVAALRERLRALEVAA